MQITSVRNDTVPRLVCEDCGGKPPVMVFVEIGRKVGIGFRGGTVLDICLCTACGKKLEKLIGTELSRPHMKEVMKNAGDY